MGAGHASHWERRGKKEEESGTSIHSLGPGIKGYEIGGPETGRRVRVARLGAVADHLRTFGMHGCIDHPGVSEPYHPASPRSGWQKSLQWASRWLHSVEVEDSCRL